MEDARQEFGKLIHDCTDETELKGLLANLLDELKLTSPSDATWTNPDRNISRVFNCMKTYILTQGGVGASDDYVVRMIKHNITIAEELFTRMPLETIYSKHLFILMYVCGFADLSYMAAKVLDFYVLHRQAPHTECKDFVGWEELFHQGECGGRLFKMPDFITSYRDVCFPKVQGAPRGSRDEQIRNWRDAAFHQYGHTIATVDMNPKLLPPQSRGGRLRKHSDSKKRRHRANRKKTNKRRRRSASSRKSKRS